MCCALTARSRSPQGGLAGGWRGSCTQQIYGVVHTDSLLDTIPQGGFSKVPVRCLISKTPKGPFSLHQKSPSRVAQLTSNECNNTISCR